MARRPEGWKLLKRGKYWHVRFTHAGRRWSVSTGEGDFGRAKEQAPRIYSDTVSGSCGGPERQLGIRPQPDGASLDVTVARWLHSLEGRLDPDTITVYRRDYATKWLDRWSGLEQLRGPAASLFVQQRLQQVAASTVRKEASALRGFLQFAFGSQAPEVPSVPKRALGTRKLRPAKAVVVDPKKLQKAIDSLPEWSKPRLGKRFPIRARIVVQYETGLRREAVSLIEWSDVRGDTLEIRDEVDKARLGREVPLSKRARAALKTLPRGTGPIFDDHDYRSALAKLAKAVGLDRVHLRALRHNRGSHLAASGVPLPAIQFLFGHKHISTTAIYIHADKEAAFRAVLGKGH
jgi:integrase